MAWDAEQLAPLGARGARLSYRIDAALAEGRNGDAAEALVDAADTLANSGAPEAALSTYEHALAVAEQADARAMYGAILWRLGETSRGLGAARDAVGFYERAASRFGLEGAVADEVVALTAAAQLKQRLEGPAEAYRIMREAVALAKRTGDPVLLAASMERLADAADASGRLEDAAASFREAARLYADAGEPALQLRATIALAETQLDLGDHVQAIRTLGPYEDALALVEDDETVGRGMGLLAAFYLLSGNREAAAETFEDALDHLDRAGVHSRRARLLLKFGQLLDEASGPQAALPMFRGALAIYEDLEDLPRVGPAAYAVSDAFRRIEQYPRADDAIDRALEICQQLGDVEGLDVCTKLAVVIAVKMGQGRSALERLLLAARVKGALGDFPGEVRYLKSALEASMSVPGLDSQGVADALIEAVERTGPGVLGPDEAEVIAEQMVGIGRHAHGCRLMRLRAHQAQLDGQPVRAATVLAQAALYAFRGDARDDAMELWDEAIAIGEVHQLPETEIWRRDRDSSVYLWSRSIRLHRGNIGCQPTGAR